MVIFPGARFHAAQLRPGRSDAAPLAAAAGHRLAGGGLGGFGGLGERGDFTMGKTCEKHLFLATKSRNSSFSTRNSDRVLGLYGKQMEQWGIEARKI